MRINKFFISILTALLLQTTYAAANDAITLNVKNGEIKDVLAAAAAITGKNIVTDNNVHGRISITFDNVPFYNALDIITSGNGLAYRTVNDIIIVSTNENITKYNNSVSAHKLSYVQAADIQSTLKDLFGNGKISIDPVTNTVLFNGSGAEEQRLRSTLAALDIATKQITLEAKIIAVNQESLKNMGINWAWDKIPQRGDNAESGDQINDYGGNFKFWRGYSFRFNAALNALFSQGKAKILATPRIITIPGKEASIFIGDHIPVQTEKHDSSGTYMSTDYLDAGIKLSYTPIISADGKMVTANVHTEVSTPVLISEIKNYKITSRTADTNVRMLSGETLVIGGLISEEEQRNIQKVPLLSNIPLLGELFKNRTRQKVKTEVIMILTPHITEAGDSPAIYSEAEELLQK